MDFPQQSPRMTELEKELKEQKLEAIKLKEQLSAVTEESSLLEKKYRSACEVRDDLKFKVTNLEREVHGMKQENKKLQTDLVDVKESKSTKEKILEALVKTYESQHQNPEKLNKTSEENEEIMPVTQLNQSKELQEQIVTLQEEINTYKNQLQTKELQITKLECEKTEITTVLKKEVSEYQEELQVEKVKNDSLLKELEILKKSSRVKVETSPINGHSVELREEIRSILREFLKWEEIQNDGQRIMSSIKEKLQFTQYIESERNMDAQEDGCLKFSSKNLQKSIKTKKQVITPRSKENSVQVPPQKKPVMTPTSKENSVQVSPQKKMSALKKGKENFSEITSKKDLLQPKSKVPSKKDTVKSNTKVKKNILSTPEIKDPEVASSTSTAESATRSKGQKPRELRPRRKK